jgi:hypothetical protein
VAPYKAQNLRTCPTKMIKCLAQYFLDEDLQLNMMKLLGASKNPHVSKAFQ